jgi:hypothetical protein
MLHTYQVARLEVVNGNMVRVFLSGSASPDLAAAAASVICSHYFRWLAWKSLMATWCACSCAAVPESFRDFAAAAVAAADVK